MGQTLTYGVYLPAEGERNCYSGLAANWQILDDAVGAIAGKANASHTHGNITNDGAIGSTAGLPIITGTDGVLTTGSFGNTAGTFCEGNDSRLSDARTPVAHTHTKSDVTDLFNTANTWSADNTYTYAITLKQTNLEEGVLPASNQTKRFRFIDKNDANLGWLQHRVSASGDSYLECLVINKFSNGQLSAQGSEIANSIVLGLHSDGSRYLNVLGDVSPDLPTRVCNLGSSTNQWNNIYSKGYYYNGTAWGLDQNNIWTGANSFYKSVQIHGARNAYIMPEFGASYSGLAFGTVEFKQSFKLGDWVDNNSTIGLNTSNAYVEIYAGLDSADNVNKVRINPSATATVTELGTSTNKWKTLNGINPGALSLPDTSSPDPISTTGWDLTGATYNTYTPTEDGWFSLGVRFNHLTYVCASIGIPNSDWYAEQSMTPNPAGTGVPRYHFLCIPVRAGQIVHVTAICSMITFANFYPCQGNV